MLCYNCMHEKGDSRFCTRCGVEKITDTAPHHLLPGTVIGNRYILGRVLGEGGFGITYLGLDRILEIPVAVKEYYPYGYSHRSNTYSNTVSVSSGENRELYNKGKDRFLREAKNVARFRSEPGIVDVTDFLEENNTAYIVMEYLDGIDLRHYLKKNGPLTVEQTLALIKPIILTLGKMHDVGLIHRDISPDNLMYMKNGSVRLMDFGAARDFVGDERSMSVMLKQGYAPEEQYRSSGKQGPWTDVYAICATIYRCITAKTPLDSLDRQYEDNLKKPSELGVEISEKTEETLMYGLAVRAEDRCQSMSELYGLIEDAEKNSEPQPPPVPVSKNTVYDGPGYWGTKPAKGPDEQQDVILYSEQIVSDSGNGDSEQTEAADETDIVNQTVAADETDIVNQTVAADETDIVNQTVAADESELADLTVAADETLYPPQPYYYDDAAGDSPTMLYDGSELNLSDNAHNSLYYNQTNDPYHMRQPGPNEWKCPRCGKIQMNYVGTCGCGQPKPGGVRGYVASAEGSMSNEWRCPRCGRTHFGYEEFCSCGEPRPGTAEPQPQPLPQPQPQVVPVRDEWKCPDCGTVNMYYVGTCGCGRTKPGGIRIQLAYPSQPQVINPVKPQQIYIGQQQNGWYCTRCGRHNMPNAFQCSCGHPRPYIPPKR